MLFRNCFSELYAFQKLLFKTLCFSEHAFMLFRTETAYAFQNVANVLHATLEKITKFLLIDKSNPGIFCIYS